MKSLWTIPLAILFGGVVVAGALYASLPEGAWEQRIAQVRPVTTADHILGNPAAQIMIVTYSDFECPYCKTFHEAMNHVIANAGAQGDIAWVFRHFPLSETHEYALAHARAAECAGVGGNEVFWSFADELFRNQPVLPSQYGALASSAGIRENNFATCVANRNATFDARIQEDRENALALGARGTPYSVILIDGVPTDTMEGGYSYAAIDAKLKTLLAE
jgi:protein-disulfide isomerase